MLIYVGRNYTATASGQVLRAVVCEKCGGEYFYSACRSATGAGTSPYGLNNRGAAARAESHAGKALDRALRAAVDDVPCPQCGWLQADMVRNVRRRRYGKLQTLAWAVPLVILVPLLIASVSAGDAAWQDDVQPVLRLAAVTVAGAGIVALVCVRLIRSRFDPNERLPGGARAAKLPPAPPALVRSPWPAEVAARASAAAHAAADPGPRAPRTLDYFSAANSDQPSAAEPDLAGHTLLLPSAGPPVDSPAPVRNGWVTVQLPRVGWPHACECCLAEPDATYAQAVPLKIGDGANAPLPILVCDACRRMLRRRWWKWAAGTVLCVALLAALAYFYLPMDQVGRAIVCPLLGTFVAVIAAPIVAGLASRPHRCRSVDGTRGFFRLWFENPGYAELMARAWLAPETHALAFADNHLENLLLMARAAAGVTAGPIRSARLPRAAAPVR